MKKVSLLLVMSLLIVTLAGCGDANATSNNHDGAGDVSYDAPADNGSTANESSDGSETKPAEKNSNGQETSEVATSNDSANTENDTTPGDFAYDGGDTFHLWEYLKANGLYSDADDDFYYQSNDGKYFGATFSINDWYVIVDLAAELYDDGYAIHISGKTIDGGLFPVCSIYTGKPHDEEAEADSQYAGPYKIVTVLHSDGTEYGSMRDKEAEALCRIIPILTSTTVSDSCPLCGSGIEHSHIGFEKCY